MAIDWGLRPVLVLNWCEAAKLVLIQALGDATELDTTKRVRHARYSGGLALGSCIKECVLV